MCAGLEASAAVKELGMANVGSWMKVIPRGNTRRGEGVWCGVNAKGRDVAQPASGLRDFVLVSQGRREEPGEEAASRRANLGLWGETPLAFFRGETR